jgi:hypothetical protein
VYLKRRTVIIINTCTTRGTHVQRYYIDLCRKFTPVSRMCSYFMWSEERKSIIIGRNLDNRYRSCWKPIKPEFLLWSVKKRKNRETKESRRQKKCMMYCMDNGFNWNSMRVPTITVTCGLLQYYSFRLIFPMYVHKITNTKENAFQIIWLFYKT